MDAERFFALAQDPLCIAGLDGFFKRVNPAWTHTTGWSAEELTSRPWLDFVHPDDIEATIAAGGALARGAKVIEFQNRYRCKSGGYRWFDWRSVPSPDEGIVYAIARDVTAMRQAHDATRELAESLVAMFSGIADGVFATDAAGAVLRMNAVGERISGWTLAEALGRPLVEVLPFTSATTRQPIDHPVTRTLRDRVVVVLQRDAIVVRRDGTELPVGDSCAPILIDGHVRGAVLVVRDRTAEREAERQHREMHAKLEVSQRMASVGTLAAGIAHEINNPLTYVATNLDMIVEEVRALSGGSTSGRMRELEEMVLEAKLGAERIRKIVRGLKTFSRPDDERVANVSVKEVLEVSLNMTFNEIRHRARLVKDYGPVPLVAVDDARLGQVFVNLLVNAAQALPEGQQDANEIRVITSTDDQGNAVVEVRDTGPGIPPEVLGRIFDPFFTTKPVGVGTGLGLSICHNIVSGMHGTITATSAPGRGTTFRIVLPRAPEVTPPAAVSAPSSTTSEALKAVILVVDDEPAVALALRRVLRAHEVTVVNSAREALGLLSAGRRFDVIFSDLMMPETSGMQFYDELARSLPEMAQRIVFMTGGAFTPVAQAFLTRVSNERLEKPFEPDAVRALVQSLIKR